MRCAIQRPSVYWDAAEDPERKPLHEPAERACSIRDGSEEQDVWEYRTQEAIPCIAETFAVHAGEMLQHGNTGGFLPVKVTRDPKLRVVTVMEIARVVREPKV